VKSEETVGNSFHTFGHILDPITEACLWIKHRLCGTGVVVWLVFAFHLCGNTSIELLTVLLVFEYSESGTAKGVRNWDGVGVWIWVGVRIGVGVGVRLILHLMTRC